MYKLLALPLVLMGLTGCAGFAFSGQGVPMAVFYADATVGKHVTHNNVGKKKGEACATSILGLVTTGDSSIRAAADQGGIKDVSTVDHSIKNILGIVATYCTVVSGVG